MLAQQVRPRLVDRLSVYVTLCVCENIRYNLLVQMKRE